MTTVLQLVRDGQPVRKSARRLRWFFQSFEDQMERLAVETGVVYRVDQTALAQVFADWLKAFNAQKPTASEDKLAYVSFAAGLMLRTLITRNPVQVDKRPPHADNSEPVYFWPEGYLYVTYCLNVRGLVIEQDFHGQQHAHEGLGDIRTWWSFKENVEGDPDLAIAFLELFADEEPDWKMPSLFRAGHVRELTRQARRGELAKPVA